MAYKQVALGGSGRWDRSECQKSLRGPGVPGKFSSTMTPGCSSRCRRGRKGWGATGPNSSVNATCARGSRDWALNTSTMWSANACLTASTVAASSGWLRSMPSTSAPRAPHKDVTIIELLPIDEIPLRIRNHGEPRPARSRVEQAHCATASPLRRSSVCLPPALAVQFASNQIALAAATFTTEDGVLL